MKTGDGARRPSRRSLSVPAVARGESSRSAGRAFEAGQRQSLSPVRQRDAEFAASPTQVHASPSARETRDSRLLHRLGYDAGDSGLDRPPRVSPRVGNEELPSDFPTFIFVQPADQPIYEGQPAVPPEGKQISTRHLGVTQTGILQSPMAKALADSEWPAFHQHLLNLERLSTKDKLLFLMDGAAPDRKDWSTLLHTAVWKAPPGLTSLLLDMLKQDRNDETRQLFMTLDPSGNTALHLWCANLESTQDASLLKRLVLGAPQALQVKNEEGDTPLHMFVSSQACCGALKNMSSEQEEVEKAVAVLDYMMEISLGETSVSQDSSGATPLHVAIAHGAHESILFKLLDEAPVAASIADERGMLPLHYAAAFVDNVTASFVESLIRAHPEALTYGTENDDTALHLLVSNVSSSHIATEGVLDSNSAGIIELLMGSTHNMMRKSSPITATNNENLNPLHCCALFDPPLVVAQHLMKSPVSERAACMENDFGATPLHLAAAQPVVADATGIVEALGTLEAAATPDRLRRTPLHVAAQNVHATPNLIDLLVSIHPDATSVKTQRGHLPLHLAAQSQAREPVVKALIRANPKAAEARSKSSNTPLHDAAKYKASPDVVKLLLETYQDAVYIQNKHGNLPLHCATAYQAPDEVVLSLLKAWPDGASMQNRSQDSPLHYAASYNTNVSTMLPLLKAAPAAVLLCNSSGESPMDRAKSNKAPPDIIKLLEKAAAEWANKSADPGTIGMFAEDFDGASF